MRREPDAMYRHRRRHHVCLMAGRRRSTMIQEMRGYEMICKSLSIWMEAMQERHGVYTICNRCTLVQHHHGMMAQSAYLKQHPCSNTIAPPLSSNTFLDCSVSNQQTNHQNGQIRQIKEQSQTFLQNTPQRHSHPEIHPWQQHYFRPIPI